MAHAGGRPRNHSDKQVAQIKKDLEKYIDETNIPILVEFAYLHNVSRDDLYNYPEFCTLRKKAIDKKEAQLERLGLENQIDKTMAIFSLKQIGWRDKQEVETTIKEYKILPPPSPEEAYDD